MIHGDWAQHLPVVQVRIARATHDLKAVLRFYQEGLGLKLIGQFENHQGYSGVMLGLPNVHYHLEFSQREDAHILPSPDPDDLLALYIPDPMAIGRLVVRMGALGYYPAPPANPYWEEHGVTLQDPDGWHLVLVDSAGF